MRKGILSWRETESYESLPLLFSLWSSFCWSSSWTEKKTASLYDQGKSKRTAYPDAWIWRSAGPFTRGIAAGSKKGNDVYEIFYEEPAFTELKTYHISYRVKDEDAVFSVKVKVVDTTAPKLSGEIQYTITQGEAFGIHDLYISAYDAYDGDLSDQLHMEEIDTSQAGEQEHTVSVHDSSGNRAEILIHITVKEKALPIKVHQTTVEKRS